MAQKTKTAPTASQVLAGKGKNFRAEGFRPVSNDAFEAAMADKRRSSATQRHTPKPLKGSRNAKRTSAIRDYS